MPAPPLRVHRFIEQLMADLDLRAAFQREPAAVLERFAIEPELRAALIDGSPALLQAIGVHPSMQFKFLVATGRSPVNQGSIAYYLDRV